jgi:hypothetical protein
MKSRGDGQKLPSSTSGRSTFWSLYQTVLICPLAVFGFLGWWEFEGALALHLVGGGLN